MSSWGKRLLVIYSRWLFRLPAYCKTHVTSRFSSPNIKEQFKCIEKHWSEMSGNEKVEAGPFLCFVNPDEYDKRQGKFVEYMILYNDYDEYLELKEFAISSGRWAQIVQR